MTEPRSSVTAVRALPAGNAVAFERILVPTRSPGTVVRARLTDLLDEAVTRPLTMVTGSAGAGKTTLMASWLHTSELVGTVAWLSVDRRDTRGAQFWGAVIDAVDAAGEHGLSTGAFAQPLGGNEFVPAFANAVSRLASRLVIVLDDLHELRAPEVSEQLDALLRHPPDKLRLVIVSRADPRLSLHRLRLEES